VAKKILVNSVVIGSVRHVAGELLDVSAESVAIAAAEASGGQLLDEGTARIDAAAALCRQLKRNGQSQGLDAIMAAAVATSAKLTGGPAGPAGPAGVAGPAGKLQFSYRLAAVVSTLAEVSIAAVTAPIQFTRAYVVAEEAFFPADAAWSFFEFRMHDADESSPRTIVRKDTKLTGGNGLAEINAAFFESGANPQKIDNATTYENLTTPFSVATPDALNPPALTFRIGVGGGIGAPPPKGLYVIEYEFLPP